MVAVKDQIKELELKVVSLADTSGIKLDRLSLAMDIELAMSEEQRADLLAMIAFLEQNGRSTDYVLTQTLHDLCGLRAAYIGHPSGKCFSPRSHGYSKR